MKRVALASLIALAAGMPALSHAFDGQIQFSGQIYDTTCNINANDVNKLVTFKKGLKPADFTTNGQPATGAAAEKFSIRLSNCTYTATAAPFPKAKIKFDNLNPLIDLQNNGLMNQSGADYAKNVQVNIYNDAAGTNKILLSSPDTNATAVTIDDTTKAVTLEYYANLVRQDTTGANVSPGVYNSAIRYQIVYE